MAADNGCKGQPSGCRQVRLEVAGAMGGTTNDFDLAQYLKVGIFVGVPAWKGLEALG